MKQRTEPSRNDPFLLVRRDSPEPLCDEAEDLDSAHRVVHTLSLLDALAGERRLPLAELGGPLLRRSQDILLDDLLADVRDRRQHMVLLVDDYGTAVGIITIEDVLEQIVGDIWDEYDDAPEVDHRALPG